MAVGSPMPEVSSELAADGIDELVRVMLSGTPEWAEFTPRGDPVEIRTMDTGDRWQLQPGRMVGIEPSSQLHMNLTGYELVIDAKPSASIGGRAIDLLLWMWGRLGEEHIDAPSVADVAAATELRATIVEVTQ